MPAISPRQLVDAIIDAFEQSGYSAVLAGSARTHPRRFILTSPTGDSVVVWAYAWTLTFGGRENLPDEFRIQMTTVDSPLAINPAGPTILIGYEPNLNLFAGFDLQRHQKFTTGSPSVQIDIRVVREALHHGLTFDRKNNDEIAVGIRPDQLADYTFTAEHLHRYGKQSETFRLLTKATSLETITTAEIAAMPEPRRRIIQAISRLSRKANFRQQVLYAYGNRCVVTKAQLRLVDAAHILPVGAPGSNDHVTNGLALSPTYHRAYDNGLIFLDTEFQMQINPTKVFELAALRLDGGIESFKSHLGKILLPPDRAQWPNLELIRKANQLRNTAAA